MSFYFQKQKVELLKTTDFNIDLDDKLTIKRKDLCLVLFHDHSSLSTSIYAIWEKLSKSIIGITFCLCDLIEESTIATSITNISNDTTSPYKNLFNRSLPIIVSYRNGRPQDLYKDVVSESRLKRYCLNLTTSNDNIERNKLVKDDNEDDEDDENIPKVVRKDK